MFRDKTVYGRGDRQVILRQSEETSRTKNRYEELRIVLLGYIESI